MGFYLFLFIWSLCISIFTMCVVIEFDKYITERSKLTEFELLTVYAYVYFCAC